MARDRDQAVQLLDHYLTMVMVKVGLKPDADTHAEIAQIVDCIIDAAAGKTLRMIEQGQYRK